MSITPGSRRAVWMRRSCSPRARQDLAIPEHGDLPSAGAGRFLMLGAGHLWHSAARLCAILGFFLLARTRRQLATVLARRLPAVTPHRCCWLPGG